jgi:hypothetical protein
MENNDINFNEEFDSYFDFYESNKMIIYKKIVDTYEFMKENNVDSHVIHLSAKISGFYWSTDVIFRNEDKELLYEHVLKYFEEKEEYEYCQKIKELMV